jgi:hypothetical protein
LLHASHCLLWHSQTVTAPVEPDSPALTDPDKAAPVDPDNPGLTDPDAARAHALIEEAAKKSALLWLAAEPGGRAYAAWHVWVDGAVLVVSGGLEQPMPVLDLLDADRRIIVTLRSKDTWGRLVTWVGRAENIAPDDDAWAAAAVELHAKRLNSPDGEAAPERWRRESVITRIVPTGELLESPTHMPSGSRRAEPPDSPATTRGRLPFTVGRRARRRR